MTRPDAHISRILPPKGTMAPTLGDMVYRYESDEDAFEEYPRARVRPVAARRRPPPARRALPVPLPHPVAAPAEPALAALVDATAAGHRHRADACRRCRQPRPAGHVSARRRRSSPQPGAAAADSGRCSSAAPPSWCCSPSAAWAAAALLADRDHGNRQAAPTPSRTPPRRPPRRRTAGPRLPGHRPAPLTAKEVFPGKDAEARRRPAEPTRCSRPSPARSCAGRRHRRGRRPAGPARLQPGGPGHAAHPRRRPPGHRRPVQPHRPGHRATGPGPDPAAARRAAGPVPWHCRRGDGTDALASAPARVGWQVRGHYLAYCLVARADGDADQGRRRQGPRDHVRPDRAAPQTGGCWNAGPTGGSAGPADAGADRAAPDRATAAPTDGEPPGDRPAAVGGQPSTGTRSRRVRSARRAYSAGSAG